jgi:hypothetical protein
LDDLGLQPLDRDRIQGEELARLEPLGDDRLAKRRGVGDQGLTRIEGDRDDRREAVADRRRDRGDRLAGGCGAFDDDPADGVGLRLGVPKRSSLEDASGRGRVGDLGDRGQGAGAATNSLRPA